MWKEDLVRRLGDWAGGKRQSPQKVLIYPTNVCNLRCRFCYQVLKPYDYSVSMPDEKWLDLCRELCDMGVRTLQISGGGEAMVRGDLTVRMMRLIKKYPVEGRLVTNGLIWKEQWIDDVVDCGWDNVIFSVDGKDSRSHDFLRAKKGAFEKTCGWIAKFAEAKEAKKAEKPLLEFSSVITNRNFKDPAGVVSLAARLGVKVVTFEPVFVSNPYVHKLKLTGDENRRYMEEIAPVARNKADELGIITNLPTVREIGEINKTGELKEKIIAGAEEARKAGRNGENPFYSLPCFEPWCWPKIEATGDVGPCSSNMIEGASVANSTFEEVWFGEGFENFRKAVMERRLPSGCANCVSTHLPINREIRRMLIEHRGSGRGKKAG